MAILSALLERRATTQTTNPQQPAYWLQKLFGGGAKTTSGIEVDEQSALRFSAVWAAVNLISSGVGVLPVHVIERKPDGTKERRRDSTTQRLIDQPNEFMDGQTFRETLQGHVLTYGNGYAEIERNGAGVPMALWPLLPNKTEPKMDGDKRLFYEVTTEPGLNPTPLPAENILHIKGLGFDGIKGYSVIAYACENIGTGLATENFGGSFFGNNSTPGGVLEHPGQLSPEAAKRLKQDFEKKQGGLANAHRMAVLEEGMVWKQTGIPAKDAQLIESRRFNIEDVARWYQVPPHMLGDMERATFSNIEELGLFFVNYTLFRWLTKWETAYNWRLFPTPQRGRFFTEFKTAAFLRGNTGARMDAYTKGIATGVMTPNEARQAENLNPVEGGDTPLVPLNLRPIDQEPDMDADQQARAKTIGAGRDLLRELCARVLRKEHKAMVRAAEKSPEDFETAVGEFYADHSTYIEATLGESLRTLWAALHCPGDVDDYRCMVAATHANMHEARMKELGPHGVADLDPEDLAGQWADSIIAHLSRPGDETHA